jgi:hypothetical protein
MAVPEDEARRAALAAIVASGRATRRRPSRATWIAASLVGAVCGLGFVLLLALDGARGERLPAGAGEAPLASARGVGCATGFGAGLGVGVALGFALGARRAAQGRDHSSRRSP